MIAALAVAIALSVASALPAERRELPEYAGCSKDLGLSLNRLTSWKTGNWTASGSLGSLEYDPFFKLAAAIEGQDPLSLLIVNYQDPAAPFIQHRILVSGSAGEDDTYGDPNSVTVHNGYAALVMDGVDEFTDGWLRIYHMASGSKVAEQRLTGCNMPGSVAWARDGSRLVIACEGEPTSQDDEETGSDPNQGENRNGMIAIVTTRWNSFTAKDADCPSVSFAFTIKILDFQAYFDGLSAAQYDRLLSKGLRIDPRLTQKTAAKDIEPETVALPADPSNLRAFVTLQENNAVAHIDLTPGMESIKAIWPLGVKSWAKAKIDVSDKDGVNLRTHESLVSWLQPDTVVHAVINKFHYLFLASEGDSKSEVLRVKDLAGGLDPEAFDLPADLEDTGLGRLHVDPLFGIKGGYNASKAWNQQGPYEKLYAYGGRGWAIMNAKTGKMVYESGGEVETLLSELAETKDCFNCDRDKNEADVRSDDSGPECETVEVFSVGDRHYAAIGMERQGGMFVYDVSNPRKPTAATFVYNRDYSPAATDAAAMGDLSTEAVKFVPASASASGRPLLLVANEVSATLATWELGEC